MVQSYKIIRRKKATFHSNSSINQSFPPFDANQALFLERIADGKVQSQSILKLRNIIISFLAGIIRIMKSNTQIQADHQESKVITQSHPSTQSYTFSKITKSKQTAGTYILTFLILLFTQQPHISRVQKSCPVQITQDRKRYSTFASSFTSPVSSR